MVEKSKPSMAKTTVQSQKFLSHKNTVKYIPRAVVENHHNYTPLKQWNGKMLHVRHPHFLQPALWFYKTKSSIQKIIENT